MASLIESLRSSSLVAKIALGTCAAGAITVGVRVIMSRTERKPDMSMEQTYPEFLSAARMEEVRPGRRLRVMVLEPEASSSSSSSKPLTLFLVHGSCARMAQYYDLIRLLKARTASYRFVAFDVFGCGGSPQPYGWDIYSTEEHRKDLRAIFDKYADKDGRNILLGHSFGTSQVLNLDSQVSAKVKALVLIGGRCKIPDGAVHPIFNWPNWILDLLQPSLTEGFNKMAYHEGCDPAMLDASTRMSNSNRMYMCKAFYKQVQWVDDDVVRACRKPVLVIHGREDKLTPLEGADGARAMSSMLPSGTLEVVEAASHQVMMEKSATVADLVHAFVQKA